MLRVKDQVMMVCFPTPAYSYSTLEERSNGPDLLSFGGFMPLVLPCSFELQRGTSVTSSVSERQEASEECSESAQNEVGSI